MNGPKQTYETPVTEVIVVKMEAGILSGSVTGERKDYGEAKQETWD